MLGRVLHGWSRVADGEGAAGITQMRSGLADQKDFNGGTHRAYFLTLLAEGIGRTGETAEALAVIEDALVHIESSRERLYEAETWRIKGEILVQSSMPALSPVEGFKVQGSRFKGEDEAEECFQKALAVARQQDAKSLELRAAMSLSRLWQQQGKTAEAWELLAPIYEWFTEGFDTPDLQEAKALLEMLP